MKVEAEVSTSVADELGPINSNISVISNQSNKSARSAQSVQSEMSVNTNHTETSVDKDELDKSIKSEQSERSGMIVIAEDVKSVQSDNNSIRLSDKVKETNHSEAAIKTIEQRDQPLEGQLVQSKLGYDEHDSPNIISLDNSPKIDRSFDPDDGVKGSPRALPDHYFNRHTPELKKKGFEERAL